MVLPVTSAMAVAFVLGEGFGRLACISFGCCYGKPVAALPPVWRRLFRGLGVAFHGHTKKIAYASGLEGVRVVPIQATSAVVLTLLALSGTLLHLAERFRTALLVTLVGALVWRFVSELLRADDRGGGKVSAYQWLSLVSVVYVAGIAVIFEPAPGTHVVLESGLTTLWQPAALLLLQAVGIAIFLYTGRSLVTGSTISFHVSWPGKVT
jgi:prolipoprotein diacylglyceryltransferase